MTGSSAFKLVTLKKRSEFKAAMNGYRFSCKAFTLFLGSNYENFGSVALDKCVLESFKDASFFEDGVEADLYLKRTKFRFGLTVTKKLGNAVVRNRIKRRLRAAIKEAHEHFPKVSMDIVILARGVAGSFPFSEMVNEMVRGVKFLSTKIKLSNVVMLQNLSTEVV